MFSITIFSIFIKMKLCSLGSGSKGNCTYIHSGESHILIDAGLSCKQISLRLNKIGVNLDNITDILITHSHGDHIGSIGVISRKIKVNIWINNATKREAEYSSYNLNGVTWSLFESNKAFSINNLEIHPLSVSHDTADPVCFFVKDDKAMVGVVTDLGCSNSPLEKMISESNAILLEFNHDVNMLRNSDRPQSLISRIGGDKGHLNNTQAAEIIKKSSSETLTTIFTAHVSHECNTQNEITNVADAAIFEAANTDIQLENTYQDRVSHLWEYC